MNGLKFRTIVADPPWSFKDELKMDDVARGAAANYSLMSNKDIEKLPVQELIDPDGTILALWVPSSLLQVGLDVLKAWGFEHKQTYIWVKTRKEPFADLLSESFKLIKSYIKKKDSNYSLNNLIDDINKLFFNFKFVDALGFGMGRLFRQSHELVLVGISSTKIYQHLKNKSQRSVSLAPNLKHSAKPNDLQLSLELMFPEGNKLEMFARRVLPGWTCLGNEVTNGEDIRVSLNKLISQNATDPTSKR